MGAYHTAYVNKNGKTVGGNCDCIAVMVPVGSTSWEGLDAHINLENLWQDTTENLSNDDARNAFRRTWEKKVRDGETHHYTPVQPKPEPEPKPEPALKIAPTPKPEPSPTPEKTAPAKPDPLPDLPRITETLDPAADLTLVNPRYKDSRQWQVNCTRCSTSVELRARGYDVTATPMPRLKADRDNDYVSILARWNSPDGTRAGNAGVLGAQGTIDRLKNTGDLTPGGAGGEPPLGMGQVFGIGGGENSGASRVWDYLPAGRGTSGKAKAAADEAVRSSGRGCSRIHHRGIGPRAGRTSSTWKTATARPSTLTGRATSSTPLSTGTGSGWGNAEPASSAPMTSRRPPTRRTG